jgi:hypothetical protein
MNLSTYPTREEFIAFLCPKSFMSWRITSTNQTTVDKRKSLSFQVGMRITSLK